MPPSESPPSEPPPVEPPSPNASLPGLCRDCLSERMVAAGETRPRCRACGSPRLLHHPERDRLTIAHIDCDAFYAAIEKRDDPNLADKPVIVGGAKRGVVSTACYIARTYGVRSAMPMFKALQACPDAVVVKPNMEKYVGVGRQVRKLMLELTPLVEPISIDEAFLDLSGTERVHHASPAVTLARFAKRVENELGITVSIGLSINKFLAKIASDLDKPRGFAVIGGQEAADFLGPKPVSILPGVGRATQERLAQAGITRIADLRRFDIAQLFGRFGSDGSRLHKLAHGIDDRRVSPERETKSVSAETTFDTDIPDAETLIPILMRLSERVAARMRKADLAGRSVTLKLKTADFHLRTRSHSGFAPTQLSQRIFQMARELLLKELDGTRYRLMGVGMSDLCEGIEADRGDLVDTGTRLEVLRETAIDRIRDKFGAAAIQRGLVFGAGKKS